MCGGYEGDLQGEADRRGDPSNQGKWPAPTRHNPIFIQQDNAKSHRVNDHQDLLEACSSDGFNIEVINQPPNSPDTNVLDLGFFASIQSLQDRTRARTIDDLIREVEMAWEAAAPAKLGKVWTSLQASMEQILLCGGDTTPTSCRIWAKTRLPGRGHRSPGG